MTGFPPDFKPLLLLGVRHSYFTAKARAYLLTQGIPFEEVDATFQIYKVIVKEVNLAIIPVVVDKNEGLFVQDTQEIIDYCEKRYGNFISTSIFPATPRQRLVSFLFELWSDQWLLLPAMHYRWSFPEQRAFLENSWSKILPANLSSAASTKMLEKSMSMFSGMRAPLGITADTIPAIGTIETDVR